MSSKKRVDILLVEKKVVVSRSQAQSLILERKIFYFLDDQKKILTKSSELFNDDIDFYVEKGPHESFVSRAGAKLFYALQEIKIDVRQMQCLDIGVSTGGFSDCLLQNGADSVIGIDVGTGQLHQKIKSNPRFKLFEKVNARNLKSYTEVTKYFPSTGFDLIVMDVSFISIKLILPEIIGFLGPKGFVISLVKPQFELGPENLNKMGIVKDKKLYPMLEKDMMIFMKSINLKVNSYHTSKIQGKDGNIEFFIFLEKEK